jgi:HEPN domain-containing protein
MRNPDQVAKDFVRQWLRKADDDLRVTRELMERERASYDPVGFHAQQAAEKYLKALLTRHGIQPPRTHNIGELLALAEATTPGIQAELRVAETLTLYGVEVRYPGERPDLGRDQGAEAIRLADHVRAVVMRHLDAYLPSGHDERPS